MQDMDEHTRIRSSKFEPTVSMRARVRKACQRCKMKKTKCDGSSPCRKCREADEVCVYSSKKLIGSRPRPRGYTEVLEEQQKRMSSGLRKMYRRLKDNGLWEGSVLIETGGCPSILEILAELDLIDPSRDDKSVTTSDVETPPRKADMSTFSPEMEVDHGQMDFVELDSQTQPQDIFQEIEPFDMIDWDVARICSPLCTEPTLKEYNCARHDLIPRSYSLKDYSTQMMEVQAQQAKLGV